MAPILSSVCVCVCVCGGGGGGGGGVKTYLNTMMFDGLISVDWLQWRHVSIITSQIIGWLLNMINSSHNGQ